MFILLILEKLWGFTNLVHRLFKHTSEKMKKKTKTITNCLQYLVEEHQTLSCFSLNPLELVGNIVTLSMRKNWLLQIHTMKSCIRTVEFHVIIILITPRGLWSPLIVKKSNDLAQCHVNRRGDWGVFFSRSRRRYMKFIHESSHYIF